MRLPTSLGGLLFLMFLLAPPSEPEISCNISGDGLLLQCTADFQKPLNYSWKFSSIPSTYQTQEVFIPKEKADASEKVTCFIKFSQTEKSSEISLAQCYPDEKGITKLGTGRAAQRNSPVHGSGEHQLLCHEDSQEQPNSHRDNEVNEEDSALEDKEPVSNGINQEDISKKENSSLLMKHADDCDVNEGEVPGNAEGGNGEHLSNSPSCSEERSAMCQHILLSLAVSWHLILGWRDAELEAIGRDSAIK
ncbi:Cd58 [Columba guinea]|nr:Cd58 [Columba guinea]